MLTCSPWIELDLHSIRQPTLIVRGGCDICVTHPMSHHLSDAIRGASHPAALGAAAALAAALPGDVAAGEAEGVARVEVKGKGHFSLAVDCMGPILAAGLALVGSEGGAAAAAAAAAKG